jgi:hypothetical protein
MKKPASTANLLIYVLMVVIISGCIQPLQDTTAVPIPTFTATITPTINPTMTPTSEPPGTTSIIIDGRADDWAGRPEQFNDPAGDASPGFLDITNGFGFVNKDALYLMLKAVDPAVPFVLFDMMFKVDARTYQITYQPGQTQLMLVDYTTGSPETVRYMENSRGAFNTVFELRLDLDDLGRPGSLAIQGIGVMAQTAGGWDAVDRLGGASLVSVNEVDPARLGSEESRYVHARYWSLPEPFVGEAIFTSPLAFNAFVALSQGGTIYTTIGFGGAPGVSIINFGQGTSTPILKLPSDVGISNPVGGPADTLILGVGGEIWQISPDGTHKKWGPSPDAFPMYYTKDGRLIGVTFNGSLIEIKQDGSTIDLAGGFQWPIGDVVVTPDGTILVYEIPSGDIIRVDAGGVKRVLVHAVLPGDGVSFGIDFDGQVYFSPNGYWDLRRLDIDTGKVTIIPSSYSPCALNRGDIVFIEPGKLLLSGDQLSWADIHSGENGILVHGISFTFAADIGPDGALYVGASGCKDQIPAQVLRIADDGTLTIYLDNLKDTINQIAFDSQGGLYIATQDNITNHVFYSSPDRQTLAEIPGIPTGQFMSMAVDPVSGNIFFSSARSLTVQEYNRDGLIRQHFFHFPEAIYEFRLAFSPDGALYGLAGFGISNTDFRGPWVLRLDPANDTTTVFAELSHVATGVMSVITVDKAGNVWVIVNPDSILYQVAPDGSISQFARKLPVDMPAIRVDPDGDIYFTVAGGIYRIFREP